MFAAVRHVLLLLADISCDLLLIVNVCSCMLLFLLMFADICCSLVLCVAVCCCMLLHATWLCCLLLFADIY